MKSASPGFLVDTNIVVYAYDTGEGEKQVRAQAILTQLEELALGSLSVQVLGEFFNTATRKLDFPLSQSQAEQRLFNFVDRWRVFDLTPATVLEGVRGARRYQLSYWDGLIWATAKLNGARCVLSEDFSDGLLLEGIRFRNPLLPSCSLV
ncbi:MAG: PIN domain-containing protein [SAR202 cluster bacterium]|nr:PIN domain-containing protein [SAR202 cluster bacterium]